MEHDSLQQPFPYPVQPSIASGGTELMLTDYEQGYAAGQEAEQAKYEALVEAVRKRHDPTPFASSCSVCQALRQLEEAL